MICQPTIDLFGDSEAGAVFSDDKKYRYHLWRAWGQGVPPQRRATFILLNPSTATDLDDDPTLRRCTAFARRWGFDGVDLLNLFAYRSAHPVDLRQTEDPVGVDNDRMIYTVAATAPIIILGWGNEFPGGRRREVLSLLRPFWPSLRCLGQTMAGEPKHPLYIPGDRLPEPFPADVYMLKAAA